MPKKASKNVRKITKVSSHSYGITIPIDDLRILKWREKQKVTVTRRGKKLIIEDWEG